MLVPASVLVHVMVNTVTIYIVIWILSLSLSIYIYILYDCRSNLVQPQPYMIYVLFDVFKMESEKSIQRGVAIFLWVNLIGFNFNQYIYIYINSSFKSSTIVLLLLMCDHYQMKWLPMPCITITCHILMLECTFIYTRLFLVHFLHTFIQRGNTITVYT